MLVLTLASHVIPDGCHPYRCINRGALAMELTGGEKVGTIPLASAARTGLQHRYGQRFVPAFFAPQFLLAFLLLVALLLSALFCGFGGIRLRLRSFLHFRRRSLPSFRWSRNAHGWRRRFLRLGRPWRAHRWRQCFLRLGRPWRAHRWRRCFLHLGRSGRAHRWRRCFLRLGRSGRGHGWRRFLHLGRLARSRVAAPFALPAVWARSRVAALSAPRAVSARLTGGGALCTSVGLGAVTGGGGALCTSGGLGTLTGGRGALSASRDIPFCTSGGGPFRASVVLGTPPRVVVAFAAPVAVSARSPVAAALFAPRAILGRSPVAAALSVHPAIWARSRVAAAPFALPVPVVPFVASGRLSSPRVVAALRCFRRPRPSRSNSLPPGWRDCTLSGTDDFDGWCRRWRGGLHRRQRCRIERLAGIRPRARIALPQTGPARAAARALATIGRFSASAGGSAARCRRAVHAGLDRRHRGDRP